MQNSVPVSWGDIVRIHGVNMKQKNSIKGLIICKGFTDPNVYYQKYESFDEVNFYRESLFQILPKSNFQMHDCLLDENSNQQQKEVAKTRINGEIQELYKKLERDASNPIKNGDEFVLKHVESRAYLVGLFQAAEVGQGAFRLEITQHICSSSIFKFKSHRSYEHEGHQIYFNDQLQIYHPKSDCFMNFFTDENSPPIYLDQNREKITIPEDHPSYYYYKNRPSNKKPKNDRIYVINESKSKCLWKLIQHCGYAQSQEKKNIISHDIVYFQHTNNNGLISTTISNPKYYLKEFTQEFKKDLSKQQSQSYECFWELIPKKVNEQGPETCKGFYARNVVTGQLLNFQQKYDIDIEPKGGESGAFVNEGLINLICEQNGKKLKLERGNAMKKEEDISEIERYFKERIIEIQLIKVQELTSDSFRIYLVNEETTLNIQFVLSSHQPIVKFIEIISGGLLNSKDPLFQFPAFFLTLNQNLLSNLIDILKALTGRIYLCPYDEIKSSGKPPNQQIQKILVETGISELLIQIIYHLYEPFLFIEANRQPCDDQVIRNKIATIFELCYKLVENIAAGNENNRIYVSRWVDLLLFQSNKINKSFIQECILGMLQNNPVSIQKTINEDKINQLINSFLQETSEKSTELTTKYLRLFSTFVKCDTKIIKKNQDILLKNFFMNKEKIGFRFKVQDKEGIDNEEILNDHLFLVRAKQVHIIMGQGKNQQSMNFQQFYSKHIDKFNYFLAYLDLLADVCMSRNSEGIKLVCSIIPLQAIVTALFDDQIKKINDEILIKLKEQPKEPVKEEEEEATKQIVISPIYNIHQPLIRIVHHAYFNNQNYIPIKVIGKISTIWYEDTDGIPEDINKTTRAYEGQELQKQKKLTQNVLSFITNYLKSSNQDCLNLSMLNTVLDIIQNSVSLGLWESMESLKELIPFLIMNIIKIEKALLFNWDNKGTPNAKQIVNVNKESLKMVRPEITKLIECKNKATILFTNINELQIDIRLRYMMKFFKGVYKATQNFEKYNIPVDTQIQYSNQQVANRNTSAKQIYMSTNLATIFGKGVNQSEEEEVILKPNIWYHKLKEMTPFDPTGEPGPNRYLFDALQRDDRKHKPQDIVLALFELPAYRNINLLNNTFKMLRAMFEQRKNLIENFRNILICCQGNLSQVYATLKFMRNKFNMLSHEEILKYESNYDKSFMYPMWKTYDHVVKEQSQRSGIIQDLFYLSRTLKKDVSLKNIQSLMTVEEAVFNPDIIYNFINQRQYNNQLFQELNLAQAIYLPLIDYIRNIGERQIKGIHRKVLFSVYQYLTMLCFNNIHAKQILMQYIPDVLAHLGQRVNADNFIYHVCLNNKILIYNTEMVELIIEKSLQACCKLSGQDEANYVINQANDFQKSRILYSLRGILLFSSGNPFGIKRNQQILMNKLQDSKFKRLMKIGEFNNQEAALDNFNLSPRQTYVYTFFHLCSVLVQSESFINIGKLENLNKYQYLLKSIQSTKRWGIRLALRAYLNRLFYVNKDKDIFVFQQFIGRQFHNLVDELKDVIQLHKRKLINEDTKIKNGIRFTFAQSQIILYIIQILITFHEMFLKSEFTKLVLQKIEDQAKDGGENRVIHDYMIKILKCLGCLKNLYPQYKVIFSFINEIKRIILPILKKMQVRYLENKSEPQVDNKKEDKKDDDMVEDKGYVYDRTKSFFKNLGEMIYQLKQKELFAKLKDKHHQQKNQITADENLQKMRYIQTIFLVSKENLKAVHVRAKEKKQSHYQPHLQTTVSNVLKMLARPQFEKDQENIKMNEELYRVKTLIDQVPLFQKLQDDEFNKLVKSFIKIDETGAQFYQENWRQLQLQKSQPVFSIQDIITTIFQLMRENPTSIKDPQKILIIKLIRCFITESFEGEQEYKLSVDKWDPQYFQGKQDNNAQLKDAFTATQQRIEKCLGSQFIISIFVELKDNFNGRIQLLNEVLLLGISYLFNGNTVCQNSILKCLTEDQQNKMLASISSLIINIGEHLLSLRKKRQNQKKREYNLNIVDTYDYYSVQTHTINKEFSGSLPTTFENRVQKSYENAFGRIFRFLQLMCENNNVQMKKFLRQQTNVKMSANSQKIKVKKTGSINFIEVACLYLRKFFKIMNAKVVNIPTAMLDFINEITQIPCLECQVSFMKSTFFEDISSMATQFKNINMLKFRDFNTQNPSADDPVHVLAQHYQKAVNLALSNFEGNDDDLIIYEFITKCEPQFLWLIIKKNLLSLIRDLDGLKQLTDSEIFDNFDEESINSLIRKNQANGKCLEERMSNILSVIIINTKIGQFSERKQKLGNLDKDKPNQDQLNKAAKAINFNNDLIIAANEQFVYFRELYQRFSKLIISIQVFTDNGKASKVQKLYFPNHPVFSFLAGETRDNIMINVKRQTSRDKLISMLSFRDEIKSEIQLNYDLKHKRGITSESYLSWRQKATYLSYFICFLILQILFIKHDMDKQQSELTYLNDTHQIIVRAFCLIQLILTFWFVKVWKDLRLPLCQLKYQKNKKSEEEKMKLEQSQKDSQERPEESENQNAWLISIEQEQQVAQGQENPGIKVRLMRIKAKIKKLSVYQFFIKFINILLWVIYTPKQKIFQTSPLAKLIFGNFIVLYIAQKFKKLSQFVKTLFKTFFNTFVHPIVILWTYQEGFLSLLMFVGAAVLGNLYGVEWYMIHIFEMFLGYSELTNIFKAVISKVKQLTFLMIFCGVFIMVFNIISLGTYVPVIYEQDLPESCDKIMGCVLTLYTSGAIGDDMDSFVFGRFIFDTVYVVFMEMLFMNIVGSKIIDAFGQLKEADRAIKQDKENFCYICSQSRSDMEKTGTTFEVHVKNHLLWNYIYYIYCLDEKPPTDFTGMEYTIQDKVNNEDVSWFPQQGVKEGPTVQDLMGQFDQAIQKSKQVSQSIFDSALETNNNAKDTVKALDDKMKAAKQLIEGKVYQMDLEGQ